MKPLKLLLIINRMAPVGGAETQLAHLARGLAGNGHDVTLCCIDNCTLDLGELQSEGVSVVELHASNRYRRAAAIPRLARLARAAEVVQCTMWDPSLWGRIAAILARRPVIVADHATDRSVQITPGGAPRANWIAWHNRLLDRFTYATVACASSQRAVLLDEGVAAEKIVHIPNGVPVEALRAAAAAGPGRAELGLPASGPLTIQIGLFRPEKNQLGALEAFREVRAKVPDAQLAFVGDGATRARVERRAAELGAGEWAHFLGQRSDVPAVLANADLMLLPSASDAMPMTVLESMAVGVPVLATDVGDVREVLAGAGACVAADDGAALAAEWVRLLGDATLRAEMAATGKRRSLDYGSAQMTRRYQALFEAARAGIPPLRALAAVS
jgi:glycosyltransferase involved in cell wall biosynthesis